MSGIFTRVRTALGAVALLALLAACGGGDQTVSSTPTNPADNDDDAPTTEIQGIATPSSISVVTATNADSQP
jgi:hypothetical protein